MRTNVKFECAHCTKSNEKQLLLGPSRPKKIIQKCDHCTKKKSVTIEN